MIPAAAPKTYSILLADDQTLIREGLAALCRALPNYRVADQCTDGATALCMILENRPDIAILDLNLPDLFAANVLGKLRDANVPTRIVALSGHSDRDTVLELLRSGVSAFLLKSGTTNQLRDAYEEILRGGIYVSPALELYRIFNFWQTSEPAGPFESLSPRERQVFRLLVEGTRAKEIGALLGLSPKTIDTYRVNLMRKLDIHNLAGLVRFAMQRDRIASRRSLKVASPVRRLGDGVKGEPGAGDD